MRPMPSSGHCVADMTMIVMIMVTTSVVIWLVTEDNGNKNLFHNKNNISNPVIWLQVRLRKVFINYD
jgi:hypothetical protein